MKTEENYGKFLDMLDLALMMQEEPQGVALTDIMEHFNVARRTAERMRDALANYFGADFEEHKEGTQKFFKLRSWRLDKLTTFSSEELAVFIIAGKTLRKNNMDASADVLERAFLKVKSLLKPKTAVVIDVEDMMKAEGLALRPGPKISYAAHMVKALREAILSFHQVRISYAAKSGKLGEYTLVPLGFLYGERNHYLVAHYADNADKLPQHFIVSRIQSVDILPDIFEEDVNFSLEAHAANSFGAYQEPAFDVEWLFSPEVSDEAEQFVFHPSQTMRRNDDGSLTVTFRAGGRLEMAWHLYTWGRQVKVIRPVDFWENMPDI
jgi:predicted DNA-binding transcriptional regulator YafY